MMSGKQKFTFFVSIILALMLGSCNMPGRNEPTQDTSGLIHTIAAQTVEAQLTQDAEMNEDEPQPTQDDQQEQIQPSITPSPIEEIPPTETSLPTQTNTPLPSSTNTPIPCDHITFIKDVSIPDGTEVAPGQEFSKTWRLKNSGSCTWTSAYSLVFVSGEAMGAPASKQLTTGTVAPGEEFDVTVNLVAPIDPGTYRGEFKLRNTDGAVFGVGNKSTSFYVEIKVQDVSGLMLDFLAMAEEAVWGSGTGSFNYALPGDISLPYGGQAAGTDAYVRTHKNLKLEDGRTSGAILETHPDNNGYIIGRYPVYLVGAGDKITAKIGFLAEEGGGCGAGDVVFQINYTIGDDLNTMTSLGTWNEKCDGTFRKISIDLTALKGKTVRFYLIVSANGASADDKAIWDSLGVVR
jgi:hypothetical protein